MAFVSKMGVGARPGVVEVLQYNFSVFFIYAKYI